MRPRETSPFILLSRLVGCVLLFLAGILCYTQTHLGIYQNAPPEFLAWLKATGVVLLCHGVLLFVAHFLGLADQKEGVGLSIVFSAAYFIQMARLFADPEMVPILAYSGGQAYLLEDSEFVSILVKAVVGTLLLFILVNVGGHLKNLLYLSKTDAKAKARPSRGR